MDACTKQSIAAAKQGRPVFITDVRTNYFALPPEESFPLSVLVDAIEGGQKEMRLRMPRFAGYEMEGKRFAQEFFLAEIYNILSSLGGRQIILVNTERAPEAAQLVEVFNERFGVDKKRHERIAYGKCLNVLDRILEALPGGNRKFRMLLQDSAPTTTPSLPVSEVRNIADMFTAATHGLEDKTILGIDIGGTDIKLALAAHGQLVSFKEFDWFPASFTTIDQLIDPIARLVQEMSQAVGASAPNLDAIGMCFPDVVIDNKIVGGEVFKTRGIREALGAEYDKSFARLTDLDLILAPYVKKDGCVFIVNDGPMAAFTAGVESALKNPASVANGVFAYTLGTELGTGWVTERGDIPSIPLEVYNFIIDLGSWPERQYEPDDLRSINNFNTNLPGTLQKFACQSGVFRMALKYLPEKRPDLMEQIRNAGFVVESGSDGNPGLYVPTGPNDMRKPFLEFMMNATAQENDPDLNRVFEEIGIALAVTGEEIEWILQPKTRERILFGRLVKKAECFALMQKGATSRQSTAIFTVADDNMAETPLMKALSDHQTYTVAQFAQAVGAIYYGNSMIQGK